MLADAELSLALFDQLREAVYVVDRERRIVFWNAAAERLTGYLRQEVTGRFCHHDILMHCDAQGTALCSGACPLVRVLADGKSHEAIVFLRHRHGHRLPVHVRSHPIHGEGGIAGAVELFEAAPAIPRDETGELESMGCLDSGLGVLARPCGELRLRQQVLAMAAFGGASGWLRVALREVDALQHRCGHAAPEAAMGLIARTLRGALGAYDSAARWDAHEFRLLIPRCGTERLAETAGVVRMLVRSSELEWWGQPVQIDVEVVSTLISAADTLESAEARLRRN
jgi:PAS domain S-box-containing protein